MINGIYAAVIYPYYTILDFPDFNNIELWVLIFCEFLFAVDIIFSFFKQELDEEGFSK
jgi:hypothetical protein